MKKFSLSLLFLVTVLSTFSQRNKLPKLGQFSLEELQMKIYDKDSTAVALVLHESANLYLDPNHNYKTRTDYYFRIKILDKKGFEYANTSINFYDKKEILDIRGITYNLNDNGTTKRTSLLKENIYFTKKSDKWNNVSFTMPDIKVGSVIEFAYSQISPYSKIEDWYFQDEIPKLKSEYDAAILGNYKYNVRIIGYLKLDKDEPSVKKNCFYIEGLGEGACVKYSYAMYDIPAFKEEDYMLSKKNYISRLSFDLESYTSPRGGTENYTTTWKQADKKLKNIFLNNQTSKKNFFKRNLPENLLLENDELKKAKGIFNYIKNHFSWNNRFWNSEDEKVKNAFEAKTGTAGEINLSLYNSLMAAEIDANLIILSTRDHGIPTKLYPVIFDFNYIIVKATINNTAYYLDATDKYLPFGQIPVRCLNDRAREISFKEASNWVTLNPKYRSSRATNISLQMDNEGNMSGEFQIHTRGYNASETREKIAFQGKEKYVEEFENDNPNLEVEDFTIEGLDELDKTLKESYKVFIESDEALTTKIRINPFSYNGFTTNPFNLKERNYPVDFAYRRAKNFYINLKFPEGYKLVQSPKDLSLSLPNKGGRCIIKCNPSENGITIYLRLNINKRVFSSEEYFALKEFYKRIIDVEKSYIILEKKA